MTSTKEQLHRGVGSASGEERRRSQRVIIRVPVTMVITEDGKTVQISGHTVAVNIHGAMIVSPRGLDADATLEIVNGRTGEKVASRVTRAPRESAEGVPDPGGIHYGVTQLLADLVPAIELEGARELIAPASVGGGPSCAFSPVLASQNPLYCAARQGSGRTAGPLPPTQRIPAHFTAGRDRPRTRASIFRAFIS